MKINSRRQSSEEMRVENVLNAKIVNCIGQSKQKKNQSAALFKGDVCFSRSSDVLGNKEYNLFRNRFDYLELI